VEEKEEALRMYHYTIPFCGGLVLLTYCYYYLVLLLLLLHKYKSPYLSYLSAYRRLGPLPMEGNKPLLIALLLPARVVREALY